MRHSYVPKKVCSKRIDFKIDDDGLVRELSFLGGCDGNLKGLSRLVEGRPAMEVADLLGSITCGRKSTSCPAQLSLALRAAMGRGAPKVPTAPKAPKAAKIPKAAKRVEAAESGGSPMSARRAALKGRAVGRAEPLESAKPGKPAEPAKPAAKDVKPVKSAKPSEPAKTVKPAKPAKPVKPAKPAAKAGKSREKS